MKNISLKKTVIVSITLLALLFGSLGFVKIVSAVTISGVVTKTSDLPKRLRIPNIRVDAQIDQMGLTKIGAMEAPAGPKNVGWFKFGVRPGDDGSAVIGGHFGKWKKWDSSVFDNLYKLKSGDKIYVEDKKGVTVVFVVKRLQLYDPKDDASEIFASDDGQAHLNLIACAGEWNQKTKTYPKRLVVFTDKE